MNSKQRTTILIMNESHTETLDVDRRVLRYIKPAVIGLGVATAVLTLGVGVLAYTNYNAHQDNAQLRQKVGDLEGFTSAEVNTKMSELRKSEKIVNQLQQYLEQRGALTPPPKKGDGSANDKVNDAAGGPALKITNSTPFMGSFWRNTENLLRIASTTPIGVPVRSEISSEFGGRANPFSGRGGEFHPGTDFRGELGDPIHATANGVVNYAGVMGGYGNVVRVTHDSGYETLFGHMSSIEVQVGQTIEAGAVVGKIGSTGRSTGPHLHYEIRKDNTPIDAGPFLNIVPAK